MNNETNFNSGRHHAYRATHDMPVKRSFGGVGAPQCAPTRTTMTGTSQIPLPRRGGPKGRGWLKKMRNEFWGTEPRQKTLCHCEEAQRADVAIHNESTRLRKWIPTVVTLPRNDKEIWGTMQVLPLGGARHSRRGVKSLDVVFWNRTHHQKIRTMDLLGMIPPYGIRLSGRNQLLGGTIFGSFRLWRGCSTTTTVRRLRARLTVRTTAATTSRTTPIFVGRCSGSVAPFGSEVLLTCRSSAGTLLTMM